MADIKEVILRGMAKSDTIRTQKDLAGAIGISATLLSMKMNGRSEFRRGELQAIARVLHIEKGRLL